MSALVAKPLAILSPAEVRERRRQIEAAAVAPLVADWRVRIANAMLAGETSCDTDTRTDLHVIAVLESSCSELRRELVSAGWASLVWRPKQACDQRGLSSTVQLIWSEVAK